MICVLLDQRLNMHTGIFVAVVRPAHHLEQRQGELPSLQPVLSGRIFIAGHLLGSTRRTIAYK